MPSFFRWGWGVAWLKPRAQTPSLTHRYCGRPSSLCVAYLSLEELDEVRHSVRRCCLWIDQWQIRDPRDDRMMREIICLVRFRFYAYAMGCLEKMNCSPHVGKWSVTEIMSLHYCLCLFNASYGLCRLSESSCVCYVESVLCSNSRAFHLITSRQCKLSTLWYCDAAGQMSVTTWSEPCVRDRL